MSLQEKIERLLADARSQSEREDTKPIPVSMPFELTEDQCAGMDDMAGLS